MNDHRYKNVLLIDDNEIDILINKKVLENEKFAGNISSASSASDALKMLKASAGKPEHPNLIFLDIMMPVMDGFGFLDEFAKLSEDITKNCKIIMLSTSESFKDLNRANKSRFVYKFLNKPLTEQVLAAINV
jgi:CheY-like chemotaxis protein